MDGLTPQTIVDQPIPLLNMTWTDAIGLDSSPTAHSNALLPARGNNVEIPPANISREVISQSIDTQTNKIKGSYTFEQLGSIVVGILTGAHISISPDGIVATNSAGTNTFALDGTTGDASFLGNLLAGSIITGLIQVGSNSVTIDGANRRILVNDGTNDRILIGYQAGGF